MLESDVVLTMRWRHLPVAIGAWHGSGWGWCCVSTPTILQVLYACLTAYDYMIACRRSSSTLRPDHLMSSEARRFCVWSSIDTLTTLPLLPRKAAALRACLVKLIDRALLEPSVIRKVVLNACRNSYSIPYTRPIASRSDSPRRPLTHSPPKSTHAQHPSRRPPFPSRRRDCSVHHHNLLALRCITHQQIAVFDQVPKVAATQPKLLPPAQRPRVPPPSTSTRQRDRE